MTSSPSISAAPRADICLIKDGEIGLTQHGHVGEWPLALPMVDMITIGAGGGSLARIEDGALTVGPQSAGARPGPGLLRPRRRPSRPSPTPTLCSASLPARLLGGRMVLDIEAAKAAVSDVSLLRWASISKPPRAASSPLPTTTWSAPSAWCPLSAVTIRATSRSCPSAAPARSMAAPLPISSASAVCSSPRHLACSAPTACSRQTCNPSSAAPCAMAGPMDPEATAPSSSNSEQQAAEWLDAEDVAAEARRTNRVRSCAMSGRAARSRWPMAPDARRWRRTSAPPTRRSTASISVPRSNW